MNERPPTSPMSRSRSTPRAMTAHADSMSEGMPSIRAASLPRPPGRIPRTAPGYSRSTPTTQPISPSPLSVTVTSPAKAALRASSRA